MLPFPDTTSGPDVALPTAAGGVFTAAGGVTAAASVLVEERNVLEELLTSLGFTRFAATMVLVLARATSDELVSAFAIEVDLEEIVPEVIVVVVSGPFTVIVVVESRPSVVLTNTAPGLLPPSIMMTSGLPSGALDSSLDHICGSCGCNDPSFPLIHAASFDPIESLHFALFCRVESTV